MAKSISHTSTTVKLVVVSAVSALLFVIVINAMRNPVEQTTAPYSADFSDVSGLHVNGDVRMRGMRIGKVSSIELKQGPKGTYASVGFTMDRDQKLTDKTELAVKYQNLTGIRYVDVVPGAAGGRSITHVPLSGTKPSFDITSLFNGLQPVLTTMRTEDVNTFTENAIALIQGDGTGLGPMLDSTQKLAEFAKNRQHVISTLTENMSRINDSLGGRSRYVIDFVKALSHPIDNAMKVLNEFQKTASTGPELIGPIQRIVAGLGIEADMNWEGLIGKYFSTGSDFLKTLEMMPGVFSGLQSSKTQGGVNKKCTNGYGALPADMTVLLAGSEVVLCKGN